MVRALHEQIQKESEVKMGGRGSSGSHNAGGKLLKNIGAGITDRAELVNLYNSISGNPSYTTE